MNNIQNSKMNNKPKTGHSASKIPTSGRDSGTHSRSSSVSNLTTASDIHSEVGDAASENAEDFKLDERVWLNGIKPGCIKFIGKTQFAPGIWAGVLLDEPLGKNDGSVAGVKYFTCEPLRGIFARPAKLTRTPGAVSGTGDSVAIGAVTPRSSNVVPSSRASVSSNMSSTSPSRCSRLRVGERITVSSLNGLKPGTLRFIGETDFAKGEWAGVELDEPTGKNDGSVAGKRYFNCQMKYGLFAPLHKVSRAGGTPISRPGSMRGTPLMRSNSRDSLSSSISNSSRASRVKLGVTSLTQKKVSGSFVTPTSKALQEALKEKDQHIEQLLKERDLDRAEFARITSHFEEVETKSAELEKKQKEVESEKKALEQQLTTVQRKLEDIQFQLEEEKISKSDFEMQVKQKIQLLKRIEEFVNKDSGEKFLNIKEILLGQEALSEGSDIVVSQDSEELKKKITELELKVEQLTGEKQEFFNQLSELQKSPSDTSSQNDVVAHLNTTIQEKDDMILNLKNELNSFIEKVTQLTEDNRNLTEQMLLKEEQAKGHADDVIKELGEKINLLNEELKTKSSQLAENISSTQEKDSKISTLELNLNDQSAALLQLQNEHKNINDVLKHKESELEEKVAVQKSLEETIVALKSQLQSFSGETEKQMSLLEEEIKSKSCQLNDYLSSIEEKENLISSLQQSFDSQAASVSQLQNEKKDLNESLKLKELELEERDAKVKSLEEQIAVLTSKSESSIEETQKKMLDLVKEIENLTNCVQEKDDQLLKAQSELAAMKSENEKLKETIQQLSEKVQQVELSLTETSKGDSEKISSLQNELSSIRDEKESLKSAYEKEIEALKSMFKANEEELQAKNDIITQHESQISLLTEKLKKNEEQCSSSANEISSLGSKMHELIKEKENIETSLQAKEELIADFTKQVESLKISLDKNNNDLEQKEKQLVSLQDSYNKKEEENNQLISKLQLAEQKVEMLNKDSSEHVKSLQDELSKVKEESTDFKTHLEQELSKTKQEKEKLSNIVSDKDKILLEKEEILLSLDKKLKDKESEISELSSQKAELQQNISKCNNELQEAQKKYDENVSSTVSEYQERLSEKEQELSSLRENHEKLLITNSNKENALLEKEEALKYLQDKLKENETEISNLTTQNSELLKNIAKFSSDIEEKERVHNEKLLDSEAKFDKIVKEKNTVVEEIQNELAQHVEIIESKTKALTERESEVNALKNLIKERDSQFDEISKMVESSQNQLVLLKEQNEKNESLLQSKESFFNDFKADQEKQLQLKEQAFKEETAKLENLINSKDEEMKLKQSEVSNLLNEIQDKNKMVESLQKELDAAKADKEKALEDSNGVYQELNNKVTDLEEKYSKLLEEKEKIAEEEKQTRDAKKNLELVRETLLQEKSAQEEIVKDREAKLEALQAEVNRMRTDFTLHKEELQQKLNVSEMELEATLELKNQLDVQHSVLEELQQDLQNSEEKCKELEAQTKIIPVITAEKNKLQAEIAEFQKMNKEKTEMITNIGEQNLNLEEQLNNHKNLLSQKEKEISSLQEQFKKQLNEKGPSDNVSLSLKSLEEENLALKDKITLLESTKSEMKTGTSAKDAEFQISQEDAEEKESLRSQVDFLNSIIVDMKQKNEELTKQLEMKTTCWEENDFNLNETKKAIAPRLFCDICDMFDLHETCDCPKQESFADEEVPQLRLPGTRKMEERPYCNNCEKFGHWTLDCDEPETF